MSADLMSEPVEEFDDVSPPPQGDKPFVSVQTLMTMDENQLQALWDAVPPERQKFYENAYSAALGSLGGGDITDDQAMGVIEQVLSHYEAGQVPILSGNRWVQVPTWVRERVERGEDLDAFVAAEEKAAKKGGSKKTTSTTITKGAKPAPGARSGPAPQMIIGVVLFTILFLCIAFQLFNRFSNNDNELTEEDVTATAAFEATALAMVTPSATPFLITETDSIIRDGEDFEDYYPVLLELRPAGSTNAQVYVVQQKPIEIADWDYDARSPEIASWISGLLVQPVIGIPYSPDNQTLLEQLLPGDIIMLHMSTGTILRFDVESSTRVDQQDKSIFRQLSPGIALVMLGEPEVNNRLIVVGSYPPQQELLRDEEGLNVGNATVVIDMGQHASLTGSDATIGVTDAYASVSEGLPDTLAYLFVDMTITTGSQELQLSELQLALTDSLGVRYTPVSFDPILAHHPAVGTQSVAPASTTQVSVAYLVPRTIASSAVMSLQRDARETPTSYRLNFVPPGELSPLPPDVTVVSVITSITEEVRELVITVNVYNPGQYEIRLQQQDLYMVQTTSDPGKTFPIGPSIFPSSVNDGLILDTRLQPGQEIELVGRYNWDGSSKFIGIHAFGYEFIAELP